MTKNLSIKIFSLLALSLMLSLGQAFAQSTVTGGIVGTVTDPQGGLVPNATVTVTNLGTNNVTTVNTNEDGGYRASNLPPGTYSVATTVSGFAPAKAETVVVEVGQTTTVDLPLTLGSATAVVDVTAEAPVINTTAPDLSTNINQTSINELPINGRRASNFVLLTPATVPDGTFGLISFRGISGLLNNSTVDGGDNNQAFQSEERGRTRIGYVISQSAVREFQVNTSNYSAEYGRSAGGVVNTVTKSGTNGFHGDLFEYYRNNKFGARNPLAFRTILNPDNSTTVVGIKPRDVRHQFGGTIGGPIVKDRLFFFFSYDQQKRNFPGLSVFGPNLTYLSTVNRPTLLGKGLTNAQIDSTLGFLNSLTGETPRRQDQKLFLPKIDWQINQNNLFTVSYNRLRAESPAGLQTQATNSLGRRSFGDDFVNVDNLNVRLQTTLSTNVLNEARFQYAQDHEFAFSQEPLPGEPLTATTVAGPRTPSVALTNGISFGTTANFERVKFPFEDRVQFADTVTWTMGRHTLKFGGDYNKVTDDIENLRFQTGSYIYSSLNDFIIDYVNWQAPIAGNPTCVGTPTNRAGRCYNGTYLQGVGIPGLKFSTAEYNFFVQDDFRITPRLTVNLGLRYEYQQLPNAVLANTSTAIIPNDLRTINEATSTLPSDKNNFGPRFGVAYDLTGDGKTTLRAGYGIYYGRIINAQIYNALLNTGNPGGQGQFTVNASVSTNCFPIVATATAPCAPVFPNLLPSTLTPASAAIQFFARDFQTPLINQFDVIVERQIMKNTVVSVAYLGSLGRSLPTFVDQNLRPLGTSTTYTVVGGPSAGAVFTLEQYGRVSGNSAQTQIQSSAKSEYNALVFQFNRRFTDGLQVQSSYTFAKATDTNQNSSPFPQNNSPYNVFDRSYDAGPSNNDVRHKFVASAVYAPTFYKGDSTSIQNYVLNGWSIAPIVTFYTGRPYDGVVVGTTLNGTLGDQRFPLNPRNAFRLPNILNVDLRLSKRFKFTERYSLEFLAEGFNIFNRTHIFIEQNQLYTRSGTTLNYNTTFGSNTESSSSNYRERQIQFATRFQF
ncbi:MAG TPA: TonB-dependent receptor [Pyrinomonadaceae bacterium]|nr:TonB-dependent receptor [Pyrinomonadaceae bacterium]